MTLVDDIDRVMHIARETYTEAIDDVKPFLREHWEELSLYPDIPLDPEFEMYAALDRMGHLAAYTARSYGELVGYALYFVRRNPHYRNHIWAVSDVVLVRKAYRNAGLGMALYDFIEADLKAHGVAVMHTFTKILHPELAMLLQARGHTDAERGFSLRL